MKNNLLKYYAAAFYLCATFVTFAQPGNGNGGSGDGALEGNDEPSAPIDDYVWVLLAIGLVYVFFKMRSFVQKSNISKD
jgi:hypothetical protein